MSISSDYFTLVILGSDGKPVVQTNRTSVSMRDGEEYSLVIVNHHPTKRADATVNIDGKDVIKVRIDRDSKVRVERPVHTASKFTLVRCRDDWNVPLERGILRVTFELEKDVLETVVIDGTDEIDGPTMRGKTVFGRHSDQKFRTAEHIETVPAGVITVTMVVV